MTPNPSRPSRPSTPSRPGAPVHEPKARIVPKRVKAYKSLRISLSFRLFSVYLRVGVVPVLREFEVEPLARTVVDVEPEGDTVVVRVSAEPEF